jgi:hypothetical protein
VLNILRLFHGKGSRLFVLNVLRLFHGNGSGLFVLNTLRLFHGNGSGLFVLNVLRLFHGNGSRLFALGLFHRNGRGRQLFILNILGLYGLADGRWRRNGYRRGQGWGQRRERRWSIDWGRLGPGRDADISKNDCRGPMRPESEWRRTFPGWLGGGNTQGAQR